MQLQLHPDGKSGLENPSGQLRRVDLAERRTEQDRAPRGKAVFAHDLFGPLEIGAIADHKLDLVRGPDSVKIAPAVCLNLARARRFDIENDVYPRINRGGVDGAAGLQKYGLAAVNQPRHQWKDLGLEERLAAGDLD